MKPDKKIVSKTKVYQILHPFGSPFILESSNLAVMS